VHGHFSELVRTADGRVAQRFETSFSFGITSRSSSGNRPSGVEADLLDDAATAFDLDLVAQSQRLA
jgi:hypothetical protein